MADPVGGDMADDAARWWRAYKLADDDQVDELRRLAGAGDDHASRQLAGWLSDRAFFGNRVDQGKLAEAIESVRSLADAGDDVAELWMDRWLADLDRLEELRGRARSGGYHASRELARRLIERDLHTELRELLEAADADARQLILDVASETSLAGENASRVLADFGHQTSQAGLARALARKARRNDLRQRAEQYDE